MEAVTLGEGLEEEEEDPSHKGGMEKMEIQVWWMVPAPWFLRQSQMSGNNSSNHRWGKQR